MGPKADLTGADLTGVQMYHVDLTGADLFEATLGNAGMQGDVLTDVDLANAFMTGANLFGVRSGGVYGGAHPVPRRLLPDGRVHLRPRRSDLSGAALHGVEIGTSTSTTPTSPTPTSAAPR